MITTMRDPNTDQPHSASEAIEPTAQGPGLLGQYAADLCQRAEQFVVSHPKQSLVAALSAGVILGWIIRRR
ncbi:MAG: hypothetical protein WD845_06770 [Pirellulales bacterium]